MWVDMGPPGYFLTRRSRKPLVSMGRELSAGCVGGQSAGGRLTLVADGGVRPQDGLLHAGALELGQDGAGDAEAGDLVLLGQLEAETLGVVVDRLDLLELEGDPFAVQCLLGLPGGEGILDLGLGLGDGLGVALGELPAREGGNADGAGDDEGRVAAALGGLGGVVAGLLFACQLLPSGVDTIVMSGRVGVEGQRSRTCLRGCRARRADLANIVMFATGGKSN
jgi:hypothetical protein